MSRTWRSRVPLLSVIGLAVLVIGCPKAPPEATPPPAHTPPPSEEVRRPEPHRPPVLSRVVPEEDRRRLDQARREREFQLALSNFERTLIQFDFDRSEIKERYKGVLQQKADFLRAHPNIRVQIEGHADERGTVQYNLALGDRRAESAKAFLAALGIDANRLSTISFGEERPLDPSKNDVAYTKNRRARLLVIGQ